MAQYRQSVMERFGLRGNHDLHHSNGTSDHVAIGVRSGLHKQHRHRRSALSDKSLQFLVGAVMVFLSLVLVVTVLAYYYLSTDSKEIKNLDMENDDLRSDSDFLTNVTRFETNKVLMFGQGSVGHGGDSRYWDRDDRRRDKDHNEDVLEHTSQHSKNDALAKMKAGNKRFSLDNSHERLERRGVGLYNEAGRNELKMYEAEYEASLRKGGQLIEDNSHVKQLSLDDAKNRNEMADVDDEYEDNMDTHDAEMEEYDNSRHRRAHSNVVKSQVESHKEASDSLDIGIKDGIASVDVEGVSTKSFEGESSLITKTSDDVKTKSRHGKFLDGHSTKSKRKPRRHKFSGSCQVKFANSIAQLVEPLESRKFARFMLQYTELEEKPIGEEQWMPRFAGHQKLEEREKSFFARDQKINCGFVKGPEGFPGTGFDLAEDDASYISMCHIAVVSCIFGNSDNLRTPTDKTVTRLSRKNVCFVIFMDEVTLRTLSYDGQVPDRMGFIGLWRIVVVKNLPYDDMRRVGKIPKLLPHRLFPSARYSIWLDSKLRLQLDPLLILEYFLWRKGYEYAISNHYDRYCVWEEVAQNKKLNKFNHTIIDQQFAFYQADGLKRFNSSDANKLLPSNVPEGSFIIRAHTPMSNLFSCLWFNEVDRFTPRDQLSFAYTYQKLRRMNPDKPFHLNMFKDCERRAIAKLFRHRSQEKRNILRTTAE
ncbi:Transmembrane protein (DUF616) [Quillaja saponaria]|uniref:Transmembrane protein (DUF616) n=1 Tax=Quillaja saponaria TaxID=32244 RepID=A0AAD7PWA8_QUISA|nr:Transmembrane protein (DUF616) [Quillaja saponaria]KAJ7969705.1 Transmembrane protein (DUF616) [Quillaja saponaria]